jgi:4-amino-4-deoxy-L-arabinose transferase-like glycosyltransferase
MADAALRSGRRQAGGAPLSGRPRISWGEIARLAALALVVILPRVLFLDADPPGDLHVHFITDEGWWAHNARQQALFGRWIMDDHNPPLWSTPVYSFLLWLVYEVLGVGLYQTRLLSGLAGAATCFAVYGFVRREATPRVAFISALVLGAGYFLLSNNRVAFTESLQLAFAVIAILAALRSRVAPGWAVVSALGLLLALLCKLSAISVGLVIAALYGTLLLESRGRPVEQAIRWRAVLVFVVTAAVGAAALGVLYVAPNWQAILSEFRSNTLLATNPDLPTGGGIRPFLWYGFREEPGRPHVLNGFFAQEVALVVSVVLLAVTRLLGWARGPAGSLERCCWWWITLTLAFLAVQTYHPDRRYLLLVPPCSVLLGLAAGGAIRLQRPAEARVPRLRAWRWLAAWGLVGFVIGLYLRPWVLPGLALATARVGVGAEAGLSHQSLLLLVWACSPLLAAVALRTWASWGVLRRGTIPGVLLLGAVLTEDVVRDVVSWSHLRFSIRDVSREIGSLAEPLPLDRRSAVGNTADTLTLETGLFSFVIRDLGFARMYMNLDGWRRFRPGLAIVTERDGKPVGGDEGFSVAGLRVVRVFEYWPDAAGRPQLRTTVYAPPAAAR